MSNGCCTTCPVSDYWLAGDYISLIFSLPEHRHKSVYCSKAYFHDSMSAPFIPRLPTMWLLCLCFATFTGYCYPINIMHKNAQAIVEPIPIAALIVNNL